MLRILQKWFGKWLLLSLLWFVLNTIDFVHLQLNDMSQAAIIGRAIMAVLDSLVLCWILAKSKTWGLELMGVIFLALFGIKILMTAIEAVYITELRLVVWDLIFNGLIASLLWSLTAVAMTVGFTQNEPGVDRYDRVNWNQKWHQSILKLLAIAIIWLVIFVLGELICTSLPKLFAPPSLSNGNNLEILSWVLPLQGLRAIFWLQVAYPLIKQLSGSKIAIALLTGCIFSVWMGSTFLLAIDLLSGIRYAHLAEVLVENFIFGGLTVLIFARNPENVPI